MVLLRVNFFEIYKLKGVIILANATYGIDMCTSTIKIYNSVNDQVTMEKNMIAIANKTQLFAYGDSAFDMYEKAPGNIQITFPLNNGVIADIKNMQLLLKNFMNDVEGDNVKPADYYVAVPTDITEVEKRAFYDVVRESDIKARRIWMVEKAVADGLGLDIDVKNSQGVMIVDVGYHTTEISIISLGGIVLSRLIKIGGLKFDEAIRNMIRKEFGLFIGEKSAEHMKESLSELISQGENALVYGRDIVMGLPVEREIPTDMINASMKECFDMIIDNVRVILERTPPELSADIFRKGLYLTGGASQVYGLGELLSKGTGLKVNACEHAAESVALGLSRIIKEDNFKSVAYTVEGMRK